MSGMESGLGGLLVLAAAGLFWLSAVNARDKARERARNFCERHGWQLLDQTVALRSLRPTRTSDGLRLKRRYHFEFSPDGSGRRRGELSLCGTRILEVWGELEDGGRLIEPGPT